MAKENWGNCISKVLIHEGGYVNHPKDPGGITNMGVSPREFMKSGLVTKYLNKI